MVGLPVSLDCVVRNPVTKINKKQMIKIAMIKNKKLLIKITPVCRAWKPPFDFLV